MHCVLRTHKLFLTLSPLCEVDVRQRAGYKTNNSVVGVKCLILRQAVPGNHPAARVLGDEESHGECTKNYTSRFFLYDLISSHINVTV